MRLNGIFVSTKTAARLGDRSVYRGALTVAGVRYTFECRLFINSDGSHFVADVPRFEPVEWSTVVQVA
jgi:hypothetical protein